MSVKHWQEIFEEEVLPLIPSKVKEFFVEWDRWWLTDENYLGKATPNEIYQKESKVVKAIIRSDNDWLEHMISPYLYNIHENLYPDGSHEACCCSGQSALAGYPCNGESFESWVPVEDEKGSKTFFFVPMCTGCVSHHWYLWLEKQTLLLPPGYMVEELVKESVQAREDAVLGAFKYQCFRGAENMKRDTGLPEYACLAHVFSELCKEKAGIDDYINRKYWEKRAMSGEPIPRVFGSPFPCDMEVFLEEEGIDLEEENLD